MDRIDINKLEIAIKYVERIAKGYNPVNNMPAEDDSALNNPNVIRCMYFIKEVLEDVKERENSAIKKAKSKEPFPLSVLKDYQYQEDKSITHFLKQLYSPLEDGTFKKIPPQRITAWLKENGYLTEENSQDTKKSTTIPTERGKELGIYTESRTFNGKIYLAVIYNQSAQEFIVKNFSEIIDSPN